MYDLLYFTDTHNSDTAPESRHESYTQELLEKQREIVSLANSLHVDALVHGGDLFHKKHPSHNSHWMIMELIEIYRKCEMPFISAIGNHDINQQSDILRQPIRVLEEAGVVVLLTGRNCKRIAKAGSVPLSISSNIYESGCDTPERRQQYYNPFHGVDASEVPLLKVSVVHGLIMPDDQDFFGDFTHFSDIVPNSDVYLCGDYHPGFDTRRVNNAHFVNPGAIGRINSERHNLERHPQVSLLHLDKESSDIFFSEDLIRLKTAKPAKDVFDLKRISESKLKEDELAEFAEAVGAAAANHEVDLQSVDGLIKLVEEMVPNDVSIRAEVTRLLREAEVQIG